MAIFHAHVQNISRSEGRSVVAASAYRAGARLAHTETGRVSDYSRRSGVVHAEIMAPESAPEWMRDRQQLWNGVEAAERRRDARLAKEIDFALPRELSQHDQVELARAYARRFVALGLVVDLAVHDTDTGNPHAHMMLTTRAVTAEGFGKKLRELDAVAFVTKAREWLASLVNARLAGRGRPERVSHRSHRDRGIRRRPTVHVGPRVREMERAGRQPASKPRQVRTQRGVVRTVRYPEIDRGTRAEHNAALLIERAEREEAGQTAYPPRSALKPLREAQERPQRDVQDFRDEPKRER